LAADAVVRLLPQELLGIISERLKEVDLSMVHYPDEMEHLLNVMAPLENSIAQVEREAAGDVGKYQKDNWTVTLSCLRKGMTMTHLK